MFVVIRKDYACFIARSGKMSEQRFKNIYIWLQDMHTKPTLIVIM